MTYLKTDKGSWDAKPKLYDETELGLVPGVKLIDPTPGSTSPFGTIDNPFHITAAAGDLYAVYQFDFTVAANATWDSMGFQFALPYTGIRVTVQSTQDSASRGVQVWCSNNGVDEYYDDGWGIPANTVKTFAAVRSAPYHKIKFVNGAAQADVKLCVIFDQTRIQSSHRAGDTVSMEDDAPLGQTIIKARRPNNIGYNVDASINGNLFVGIGDIQADAGARVRVSQFQTLGDYKSLGYDHTLLIENAGTGTGTWAGNKFNMSVTAGQWYAKSSRRPHPYFSGKSQAVEATFDNFHPQDGVTKRFGYFSSSTTSPFSATLDGFWLESAGGTITLKCSRAGTETLSLDITNWSGYEFLNSYQDPAHWENFTVCFFDFLWLGGAILRLWVKTQWGFVLAHQFDYAGSSTDVFILSPNQPIRYEIRSTTGAGSFRYICAQVSTEGSVSESGTTRSVNTGTTAVTLSLSGTTYPLIAVRKNATYRDIAVKLELFDLLISSADTVLWTIEINPTLSAGLTYSSLANSAVQSAVGTGAITVTTPGTVIASGYVTQNEVFPTDVLKDNFLSYLGGSLAGTQDEYVFCITPITTNVSAYASATVKEY